ncbi:MAG: GNAT family N-acetyltransferase [Firmicutes bacterium]|nr:GNAT family N-acetyltransferase [Bacillota bacterium]
MHVQQIDPSQLSAYAKIPISFEVATKLEVCSINSGLGGLHLVEKPCTPYVKDYDLLSECQPLSWEQQFDVDAWGLFVAFDKGIYVGGAAVTPEMEGFQRGTAVLWDLRVQPDARNNGIGEQLLEAVVQWSIERGYGSLMVETQNVNTPACKFYSNRGFVLGAIDVHGYSEPLVQHEIQLMWYRNFS